jgi:hypothetical protein
MPPSSESSSPGTVCDPEDGNIILLKTLVIIYQSPWCNISGDLNLQHLHENLISHRNRLFQNYSKDQHVKYIPVFTAFILESK